MFAKDASSIDKDQLRPSLRSRVSAFGAALKPVNTLHSLSLANPHRHRGAPCSRRQATDDGECVVQKRHAQYPSAIIPSVPQSECSTLVSTIHHGVSSALRLSPSQRLISPLKTS